MADVRAARSPVNGSTMVLLCSPGIPVRTFLEGSNLHCAEYVQFVNRTVRVRRNGRERKREFSFCAACFDRPDQTYKAWGARTFVMQFGLRNQRHDLRHPTVTARR